MTNHTNQIDDVSDAPIACPECDGKLTRHDFDDEPDTGCTACVCFGCDACDVHWIAPAPRKEKNHD